MENAIFRSYKIIFTVSDPVVQAKHRGWVSVDVDVKLTRSAKSETIYKTALLIRHIDVKSNLRHQVVFSTKDVIPVRNSILPS